MTLVISCEHAGNEVPVPYKYLFEGQEEILKSHRGWDPGALKVALLLAARFNVPCYRQLVTRLLVECNRSLDSKELFSSFTRSLPDEERTQILSSYYHPYRGEVTQAIAAAAMPVIHFSIHTFTPQWDGKPREVEVGLLFDPARKFESDVCRKMMKRLAALLPGVTIRFNEPYLGTDDGFTTYLRKQFSDTVYAGVEIELSQKVLPAHTQKLADALAHAISDAA